MQPDPEYRIYSTIDPQKFGQGARMMAESEPWITLGIDYDHCLQAFSGPCKEIFIIESESVMKGFVILQVCGTFSGYIQTLCVASGSRGKGLGWKLLEFSEQRIHESSPNVFICVSSFNQEALKLYYSFGFTLVGTLKDFVKAGFDELLLRKTIGPRQGYMPASGKDI